MSTESAHFLTVGAETEIRSISDSSQ